MTTIQWIQEQYQQIITKEDETKIKRWRYNNKKEIEKRNKNDVKMNNFDDEDEVPKKKIAKEITKYFKKRKHITEKGKIKNKEDII